MSKKIGIIAEDNSDYDVIKVLIGKIIPENSFRTKKFIGKGCGKLFRNCEAWTDNLFRAGCDHVLVFHDLDRNNETDLRRKLESKVSKWSNQSLIVIPIEELEAWLLSDMQAVKKALNLSKKPNKIYHCERVESPKEHLESIVKRLGKRYVNNIHNVGIAKEQDLSSLRRCNSFLPFENYVKNNIHVV